MILLCFSFGYCIYSFCCLTIAVKDCVIVCVNKKISAVIIAKNEEVNLVRCLASLSWVDEIVVYDSGSTDKTVDIAKNMGAKVSVGPWLGFGPSKKHATALATNDWIISVDADEEISPGLADEIRQIVDTTDGSIAFKIPRLSFYMGRWIRHGGWYPDYQIRLFNRQFANWNMAPIHEKVEATELAVLKSNMHHYVFKNIDHQVATNNKYSTLQAQALFEKNKSFSFFHFLTKPYVKFIECYILKLGFLDGWAGYIIARNAAYSVFLKWVKLKELYDNNK